MAINLLLGTTVFLSAFLLFLIQPIAAKAMLPTFGGTSAVWVTSLVFFQTALLFGYAYADRLNEWVTARYRIWLHIGALLVSLVFIPLQILSEVQGQQLPKSPITGVLLLLLVTLGLPYFLLSSTGPLLQTIHHKRFPGKNVYRLFAVSNLASLGALVAYPFTIERMLPVSAQLQVWSAAYVGYLLLCTATLWIYSKRRPSNEEPQVPDSPPQNSIEDATSEMQRPPSTLSIIKWLCLSATASALLVATTSHMTQNIASIPLFWVLPLGMYLLSFVITFDSDRWYSSGIAVAPVMFAPFLMVLTAVASPEEVSLVAVLAVNTLGLLACCWFLHGELSQSKPAPKYLTRFYLTLSAGGALGGVFASILAPLLLNGFYEYRALLVLVGLISIFSLWTYLTSNTLSKAILGMLVVSVAGNTYMIVRSIYKEQMYQVDSRRNFYAVTKISERVGPDGELTRILFNGNIRHGSQILNPLHLRNQPVDYYGKNSGVGKVMNDRNNSPSRIGVIGLGAGVLATYARAGDSITFFEINPQSIEVATSHFTYLSETKGKAEVVMGDARIELQKQRATGASSRFDVFIVDAFSGDAIPVHLLTKEAFELYFSQLTENGILVIHISNKYLDLSPVIAAISESLGLQAHDFTTTESSEHEFSSRWVVVTKPTEGAKQPAWLSEGSRLAYPASESKRHLWTDAQNNVLGVLLSQN